MLTWNVTYHCKSGQRSAFYQALCDLGIKQSEVQDQGALMAFQSSYMVSVLFSSQQTAPFAFHPEYSTLCNASQQGAILQKGIGHPLNQTSPLLYSLNRVYEMSVNFPFNTGILAMGHWDTRGHYLPQQCPRAECSIHADYSHLQDIGTLKLANSQI